jgi:hypothetical protein
MNSVRIWFNDLQVYSSMQSSASKELSWGTKDSTDLCNMLVLYGEELLAPHHPTA